MVTVFILRNMLMVTVLIILNMLIAQMIDTYTSVRSNARALSTFNWAQFMLGSCMLGSCMLLQGEGVFALKKTRASGRNVGKVFNPVVKLVLENQPFLSCLCSPATFHCGLRIHFPMSLSKNN